MSTGASADQALSLFQYGLEAQMEGRRIVPPVVAGSSPVKVAKRFLRLKARHLTSDQRLRVRIPQEAPIKGTYSKYFFRQPSTLKLRVRIPPVAPGRCGETVITLKQTCLVYALLVQRQ